MEVRRSTPRLAGLAARARLAPIIDNDRVTVRDVRLANGASVINPCEAGDIRFGNVSRAHHEESTMDRQSVVMAELKWPRTPTSIILEFSKLGTKRASHP